MGNIKHSTTVTVPVEVAFGYIDNYRNVPSWMFGISRFDPVGDRDQGLGAVFDASIKLGPKTLHIRTEVTEHVPNERIAMTSIKGLESTVLVTLMPQGSAAAELTMEIGYKLPSGFAGKALGTIIDAVVGPGMRYTEHHLVREIEAFGASGAVGKSD
ncbi:SRPBCC family protein [Antrihabitans cavernicola]|uniref:SRPBCC family protein n=1 Tax=Antrihabitans cavernicola TaxID=2495913 RepID=A0A5A7S3G9_9NOCA|nr:SRPBCC family protein [Spelaeibacter cavernicola]KAA0019447.1 SRPBCC family protein [Spelaeibacter cavernicola]